MASKRKAKRSKKNSKNKGLLQKFVFSLGIAAVLLFITSFVATSLGDKLLASDRIRIASDFYKLARITNPFNREIDKRLLGTDVIKKERTEESEETAGSDNLAYENSKDKYVLGASVSVPVLMYHYIRINPNPSDRVGYNLSVTPGNFSQQMDYLATHGYHTISLDELGNALLSHGSLPSKPIVITLDDSYADAHDQALPILQSHGFKAVSFVITGLVGTPNFLTWGQIDEMKNSGVFTFGAHTVHHYALTSLAQSGIQFEVVDSKNTLQSHLGYTVNWLAYPYGNVNNIVSATTQQAGYVGAFGTNRGTYQSTDRMFTLPRVRIGGSDTIASFASKVP